MTLSTTADFHIEIQSFLVVKKSKISVTQTETHLNLINIHSILISVANI